MELLKLALMGLGYVLPVVGGIWFLIEAFKEGILWGLGCVFVPLVALFFLIKHWEVAAAPFCMSAVGFICMLGANAITS